MERGEMAPNEKIEHDRDVATTTNGSDDDKREEESGEQTMTESSQELDKAKGEVVSNEKDIISEWQEGNHKVIERRTGPSEEVGYASPKCYNEPN
jgi:hypothetical protein